MVAVRYIIEVVVLRPFTWAMFEGVVVVTSPIVMWRIWPMDGMTWELKAMLTLAYLVMWRNAAFWWILLYRDWKAAQGKET